MKPPARHQVERRGRHRRVGGRATRNLHDRRADLDRARPGGEPREHGHRVGSPRLRRPDRVVAEPLRLLGRGHELRRVRAGRGVAEVQAELHRPILRPYCSRPVSHPELQQEQAYVDHAYACLDRMRATLGRTQSSMATEFAAVAMEAWAKRQARTFQDAENGLCFGRLTLRRHARPALRRAPLGPRRGA